MRVPSLRPARSRRAALLFLLASAFWLLATRTAHAQETWHVDDSTPDGLVAHWKFDEVGSSTALPYVGPAAGTLQNGASMTNGPVPGGLNFITAGVLLLDGTDARVQVADNPALNLATGFTVAAWVQRDTTGAYHAIYDSGEQANEWWIFLADGSAGKDNRLGFGIRGVSEVYSTVSITDTNYHHIAVTKSGDVGQNLTFYVDGIARGAATVGSLTLPSGDKHIGGLQDGGGALAHFDGRIEELRLYNRALSAAEVQRLAQGASCSTDGATWDTAFRDLHCALAAAGAGDSIWIGAGTYKPGTSRFVAYALKNGVNLFGGFTGTAGAKETALGQRPAFDPNAPLTILSGDILGNDAAVPFGDPSLYDDNAIRLLVAAGGVSAGIDGLAVQGGNADGSGDGARGGALLAQTGTAITLTNVSLSGNQAADEGGAIFSRAALALTGVAVVDNKATAGGGLMVTALLDDTVTPPIFMTNSRFERNHATTGSGGGVRAEQTLQIVDSDFLSNTAQVDGGGIFSTAALTLINNRFTGNRTITRDGGGVFASLALDGRPATVSEGNLFQGNVAGRSGGGARLSGISTGDTFLENRSASEGGGLLARGTMTVTQALFLRNQSFLSGAISASGSPGVFPPTARLTVVNSLFAGNTITSTVATVGTELRLFDMNVTLLHNTFGGPAATSGSKVAGILFRGSLEARNNIFADYALALRQGQTSTLTLDTNVLFNTGLPSSPGITALNVITGNPAFLDPAAGDYHIGLTSSARNVGLDAAVPTDFEGDLRPTGPAPDIGFDEALFIAPTAAAGGPYQGSEGSPIALDGSGSTDDSPLTSFAWDCTDDGTFETTLPAPTGASCTYPDNGAFTVRLRVTDSLSETSSATAAVTVANLPPAVAAAPAQSAEAGKPITVALGSFSDPGPDAPWQVRVDWGDGTPETTFARGATGALPAQAHTFASAGIRTVTVEVADKDSGQGSASFTVTVTATVPVTPEIPPVADAGGPYMTTVGDAQALDGSGSTDDGSIFSYEWDCTDDGSFDVTGGEPTGLTCTYEAEGTFSLRLRVTDDVGLADEATTTVIVLPAAADPTQVYLPIAENP